MLEFIRRHWIAYIIGIIVALIFGFGVSYIIGIKASTPDDVRNERLAAEKENAEFNSSVDASSGSNAEG